MKEPADIASDQASVNGSEAQGFKLDEGGVADGADVEGHSIDAESEAGEERDDEEGLQLRQAVRKDMASYLPVLTSAKMPSGYLESESSETERQRLLPFDE